MAANFDSPYELYLSTLASWPTAIASSNQWFLWFDISNVPALTESLAYRDLNRFEGNFGRSDGWYTNPNVIKKLTDGEYQYYNKVGCVFAKQVNLPSDGFEAGNNGLDYGGWLPPATSGNRNKYNKLKIVFTETNASFIDFVIRPWLVLASYNGLVARPEDSNRNVKCSWCDVNLLARTVPGQPQAIRKIYRFNNIVPVSIEGEQYSYMSDDLKYSSVDFVYDQYYVRDVDSGTLLDLK